MQITHKIRVFGKRKRIHFRNLTIFTGELLGFKKDYAELNLYDLFTFLQKHYTESSKYYIFQSADILDGEYTERSSCKHLFCLFPEYRMSPKQQVDFCEHLVHYIRHGYRIVLFTLSDYFLKHINTMIMISNIATKRSKTKKGIGEICNQITAKLSLPTERYLFQDEVIAYDFNETSAQMLPADYRGICYDELDKVINKMNWQQEELLIGKV